MDLRAAILGFAVLGGVSPALGAAKARFAPPPPKLATAVNLENKRPLSLLKFEIVMPARDKAPEVIVVKLEKPLQTGESASLPLTGATGCMFEARWKFEDADDSGAVDLCNDAHIVLVD